MTEIKMMIGDVQSGLQSLRWTAITRRSDRREASGGLSPALTRENGEPEDISDPADAGISSAPAAVMRAVTSHLAGARRRVLEHIDSDLIRLGLLDEPSADQLIRL